MIPLFVRDLGVRQYQQTWHEMKAFTDARQPDTPDEFWLVQHSKVFTQGQAGKQSHILRDIGIPIIQSDRGGQVTYHGPGQLIVYVLIDLRRKKLGVRDLVTGIENSLIELLAGYEIEASAKREAPGVYVQSKKVAALGLRVRKGCSFHGLSLNVNMDLTPFEAINPCGYEGLGVTQLSELGVSKPLPSVCLDLVNELSLTFRYDSVEWQ